MALVLGMVIALARMLLAAVRGRDVVARRIGRRAATVVTTYLAVVVVVSLLSPRAWVAIGEEQGFDDWSLTVLEVRQSPGRLQVAVRVANHGKGRPQSAPDAELLVVAADGRRFEPDPAPPAERSLRSLVQPGEAFQTIREYALPEGVRLLGLDIVHGAWPEWFVIGDRGSFLHKRPLVRVPQGVPRGRPDRIVGIRRLSAP